ncbi:hypothetical protein FA10DRAFT_262249 [Acaromyces ingoldii]|uniref:Uncharacterized protein n=1 Tax=Acaromyces ingoldii TaxID=215250 RepID=A0A316YGQ6_9BASI|nr:hypothetical protein FA10DRAFT_262249 [Acaromyces ingoldii]PWN87788.1 hypothetical protein FA10DRAFT_262249 [Acaromyces ingoldii]
MRSLIFILLSFTFALIATYAMPMDSGSSSTSPHRNSDLENMFTLGESATSPGKRPYIDLEFTEIPTDAYLANINQQINQFGDEHERSRWPVKGLDLFQDWMLKFSGLECARQALANGAKREKLYEQWKFGDLTPAYHSLCQLLAEFIRDKPFREDQLIKFKKEEEDARERLRVWNARWLKWQNIRRPLREWKEQWLKLRNTKGEGSESGVVQHRTDQRKGNKGKGKASDDEAEPLLAKSKKGKEKESDSEDS